MNDQNLVNVNMPIGELVDRGFDGVWRISINGIAANGIANPYKNGYGMVVCNQYWGYEGNYEVRPETIALVEFIDPDEIERKAKEKADSIRDLMRKYPNE